MQERHVYLCERGKTGSWWAGSWPRDLFKTVRGLHLVTWVMRTAFHCSHLPGDMAQGPRPSGPPQP